jgi:PAS domain S-box-containing protein
VALALFFGALLLALWSLIGWGIQRSHAETDAAVRRELSNFSWAFAETVNAAVETIDISAQDLRDDWSRQPDRFAELVEVKQRRLAKEVVFQVGIIDAAGRLKFSSLEPDAKPVNLSDREHFQVHRSRPDDQLFISKPVLGRVSGRWSIQFTRPIFDTTGRFDGVIVLSVAADHFTRFYKTINFRPDSVSSLLNRDGHILARWPAPEGAIGSSFGMDALFKSAPASSQGWVEQLSALDQVRQLLIWRKVEAQELYVVLGISTESMFAAHRLQRNIYLIAGMLASVFLILFGLLFIRALRRSERTSLALSKSEERWKFALEGGGDAVWDWNLSTGKVVRSSRWAEILGFEEHEIGNSREEWLTRLHPQDKQRVLQTEQAHRDDRQNRYVAEYRLRARDGAWRWVLDRGMVITRDAAGQPIRMIGTMSDITLRREQHQQLMDSQRFLRTLTDALPSMVGYWRPDMTCSFANLAYHKAFPRSSETLENCTLRDMLGEALFQKNLAYFEGALAGYEQMFECDYTQADGSVRYLWAQYLPDAVDAKVRGVFSLVTDVSTVKATQTRLELLNRQLMERSKEVDQPGLPSPPGAALEGALAVTAPISLDLLLVEDYQLNRDYAVGLLEFLGHRVTLASDGQEALDWVAKKTFDLVLMDLQMPVMNGLEATRQIRLNEAARGSPAVRIIAMTAFAQQREINQCFEAGMDDVVSKPFTPDDLARHLNLLMAAKK